MFSGHDPFFLCVLYLKCMWPIGGGEGGGVQMKIGYYSGALAGFARFALVANCFERG